MTLFGDFNLNTVDTGAWLDFYNTLSDDEKAAYNAMSPEEKTAYVSSKQESGDVDMYNELGNYYAPSNQEGSYQEAGQATRDWYNSTDWSAVDINELRPYDRQAYAWAGYTSGDLTKEEADALYKTAAMEYAEGLAGQNTDAYPDSAVREGEDGNIYVDYIREDGTVGYTTTVNSANLTEDMSFADFSGNRAVQYEDHGVKFSDAFQEFSSAMLNNPVSGIIIGVALTPMLAGALAPAMGATAASAAAAGIVNSATQLATTGSLDFKEAFQQALQAGLTTEVVNQVNGYLNEAVYLDEAGNVVSAEQFQADPSKYTSVTRGENLFNNFSEGVDNIMDKVLGPDGDSFLFNGEAIPMESIDALAQTEDGREFLNQVVNGNVNGWDFQSVERTLELGQSILPADVATALGDAVVNTGLAVSDTVTGGDSGIEADGSGGVNYTGTGGTGTGTGEGTGSDTGTTGVVTETEQEPTAQEPTAQEPTAQEPTAQEPTAQEPTAQEPTGQEPTGQEPTAQQNTEQEASIVETTMEDDPFFNTVINEARTEREAIAEQIAANGVVTDEIRDDLAALGVTVEDIRTEFGDSVDGLNSAITGVQDDIADVQENVAGLNTKIDDLSTEQKAQLDAIAGDVAANGEMTVENAEALAALGVDLNDFRSAYETDIEGLGTAIDNTNEDVTNLTNLVTDEFGNVRTEMDEGFSAVTDEFGNVRTEMDEGFGQASDERQQIATDLLTKLETQGDEFITALSDQEANLLSEITGVEANVLLELSQTEGRLEEVITAQGVTLGEQIGQTRTDLQNYIDDFQMDTEENFQQAEEERAAISTGLTDLTGDVATGIGAITGLMGGYSKLSGLQAKNAAREKFKPKEQGLFDYTTIDSYQARPLQQVQIGTGRGLFS
jgi:archaellum component FlaC